MRVQGLENDKEEKNEIDQGNYEQKAKEVTSLSVGIYSSMENNESQYKTFIKNEISRRTL